MADASASEIVTVRIADDGLKAYVGACAKAEVTAAELEALLAGAGVTRGLDAVAIELAAGAIRAAEGPTGEFAVASGRAPRHGEGGRLDFLVDVMTTPHYEVDESGRVNFHEPNVVHSVEEGTPLVRVIPPGEGESGVAVSGEGVPARKGEPVKFRTTSAVRESGSEPGLYVAAMAGSPVFEGGELTVRPTVEVGDVDYATGDIDFDGLVVVRGDVLDEFTVTARRGLEVSGTVGAARVESGGALTVRGGVAGHERAVVKVEGNMFAKYVNDVTVECGGDLIVTREIVNSRVRILGRLGIEGGSIIGGDICALRGVYCKTIGSELGVRTVVTAGVHHVLEREGGGMRKRIRELADEIAHLRRGLGPALKDPGVLARMPAPRRKQLAALGLKLKSAAAEHGELQQRLERMIREREEGWRLGIRVYGEVHPGAELRVGRYVMKVVDAWKGPVTFVPDRKSGTLKMAE